MELLKDRRVIIGAGIALGLFVLLALVIGVFGKDKGPKEAWPKPTDTGIIIEQGRPDDARLDPKREVGCYVAGAYAGLTTWAECAKRNGVATGDLDVGIDESGTLSAAAGGSGTLLTPVLPAEVSQAPAAARGPTASCWRYTTEKEWTKVGDMTQNACIQTLFAGKCEAPGSATYGTWSDKTLRLIPGEVQISPDGRTYRTVVEQAANCSIPQAQP